MAEINEYLKLVSDYTKISHEVITSKLRMRKICEARQLTCYLLQIHTTLSLWAIARLLGYKSHASVIRDKKQIEIFLEIDKAFINEYQDLIRSAKELHNKLNGKEGNPQNIEKGDICWFWNATMPLPLLAIFESFSIDYQNRIWFRTNNPNNPDYLSCNYAGLKVLPAGFIRPSIIDQEVQGDREGFFDESLIQPEPCKLSTIHEQDTKELKLIPACL
jgi:hypothetical protein